MIKLGVVMDPIASIKPYKDSTFAMMLEAQRRQWEVFYIQQSDMFLSDGRAFTKAQRMFVTDSRENWWQFQGETQVHPLAQFDAILMRKDPPFDMEYVYSTFLLEVAEAAGVLVINKPQSLRDTNEKVYTAWFPQCCPPTLVSRDMQRLRRFAEEQHDAIFKPLDGMGGASIFRIKQGDPNLSVILETLTQHGRRTIMGQRFIPEITKGDKRILMINGEPVPYALARIPAQGETRGNLAAGGRGEGRPLTERDKWLCQQVGPTLRAKGLMFVGLDVIGDYLTEINVTSPTCIRELDEIFSLNIASQLFDVIAAKLAERP